jgi:RHS repeat-associated protein
MFAHGSTRRSTLQWRRSAEQSAAPLSLRRRLRTAGISFLLAVTLLAGANGPLATGLGFGAPALAHAQGLANKGKPNVFDPHSQTNSINHFLPAQPTSGKAATLSTPHNVIRSTSFPMQPGTLALDPSKAGHFKGSDGRLEIDVPAGAITPADAAAAGGGLSLRITQIAPASGSAGGGSGLVSFGTYLVQVVDAKGQLASHGLRQPVTLRLHYGKAGAVALDHAFVVINGSLPASLTSATAATPTSAATATPGSAVVTASQIGLGSYRTANTTLDAQHQTLVLPLSLVTPSSSLSWNTNSNLSAFGKPDPFSADLSGGALTAGLPIDVPAGPGGLTPPITLGYSSAGVAEQHSPQGAAGWVGEGWNLSIGSITWTEKNYTSYCDAPGNSCANTWQNTWQLSDPFGTSAELIPPNDGVSTWYEDTPNIYYDGTNYHNVPSIWHTSSETYTKIVDYAGPFHWNPSGPNVTCFRVWLKNGLMEEFGCTPDGSALQYYVAVPADNPNNPPQYYVSGWLLDMITDPQGNQIHFTYQPDTETSHSLNYPRDMVLKTIEWDSPGCHNPQTMCTGSSWQPLVRVNFVAGHSPTRLTNSPSGCNTGSNLRCDDPLDLSGSNGMAAPQVQSTFVLNDVKVQVNPTSGGSYNPNSWNVLRDYQLSYEQSGPHTITDPATGKSESVAGMLDLTKFQQLGTDQNTATGLPLRIFGYSPYDEHYEDAVYKPNPSTNCGPSWNTGSGSGCLLWSTSYAGNDRYLTSASNGLGLAQTFTYAEARNNTHGVNGGGATNTANPLYCNTLTSSQQATYPCSETDDQNWSRMVLTQQQGLVVRAASSGNVTVTSTTGYQYTLTYPLLANWCGDCVAGMYWGDQTDGDYLDYYNGVFMGFAQAQVANPDGSVAVHKFYGTEGYGMYDKNQVKCNRGNPSQCNNAPWWDLTNAAHGHEYETDSYDTNGTTLLKKTTTQYQSVCPLPWVSGTPAVSGFGNFNGNRVAELDLGNPVAVCDVRTTRTDAYTYDGSTASGVPDQTVSSSYSYDSSGHLQSQTATTSSNDGGATGSPTTIADTTSFIWNDAVTTSLSSASGTYLVEFPALAYTADSAGANRYHCDYTSYDGHAYATGQQSGLTLGEVTTSDKYFTSCGTSPNWTPSGLIETKHTYDTYGNALTTIDPDANAGVSGHVGCTVGSTQYSSCDAYDTTFDALPTTSKNALNQTSTTGYNAVTDAAGGFGLWPTSTTDFNNQATTFTYDTLGRMLSQTLPGEGTGLTTQSWTYTDWCATLPNPTGPQVPCVELDETKRIDSATTVVSRAFYDGYGQLVETRDPAPGGQDVVAYASYDASGHMVFESNSYLVTAYTGNNPGAAAYSIPDSTVAGTSTTYDGLERPKSVTDVLSHTTNTSYAVVCNAPGTGDSACYEQSLAIDPLGHQQGTLTDALGRQPYIQRYTGNSLATYTLYVTTKYTYDYNGNLTQILQPDGTTTTTFTFDMASRKTGQTDPDRGTESYSYDADGNLTKAVDGRGAAGTVYAGYDGLDRLLWRNNTNSPTGARVAYTYDSTAGGNDGVGRLTGETFTGGTGSTLSGAYGYVYNQRGQSASMTTTVNGTPYAASKTYDDAGNTLTQTYPDGEVVTNSYTAQGWLSGLSTQQSGTTTTLLRGAAYTGAGGAAGLLSGANLGGNPNTLEDSFTRANQAGWGTSTNSDGVANAAWGLDGTASSVNISNNTGVFGYQGSKNVVGIASLGSTTHDGGDALAKWSISTVSDGVPFISLNACSDKSCYYGARVNTSSGNLELARESGGKTTVEASTSFAITANTSYWTRLNVNHTGSSTIVSLKVWQDGTAEPALWTLTWTDSSPLAAGYVGAGGTWVRNGSGEAISYACYGYSAIPAVSAVACGIGANGMYAYAASYDLNHRLSSASLTRLIDSTVLFQTQPSFDAAGNVVGVNTTLPQGTDNQAFCYDEQNRLTWASSASGSIPCGGTNTAGTLTAAQYTHSYAYDTLGRLTSSPTGSYSYGPGQQAPTNPAPLHGALAIGSSYTASYDAAGNMTCRAPTSATTCSGGTPTGAPLTYDNEGWLNAWQNTPSSPTTTISYLYDGDGQRLAQQVTTSGTTTTTAYLSNIEEVATTGSTTTTTTYYYAGPLRIAEAVNGVFSYLGADVLGSADVALTASGTSQASQLYGPYGGTRYTSGTMPTDYGFTGQHADAATGLDYYGSRYYDPIGHQFVSADTALPQSGYNPWGLSRYAYVHGNPETLTDPDGHCWPLCTMLIGAVVGAVVGAAVSVVTQAASGQGVNWGEVGKEAAVGAVSGAIAGLAGPEAGPLGGLAAHALIGAASGAGGQLVSNLMNHKPLGDGVLMAGLIGGVTGGAARALGPAVSRGIGRLLGKEADSVAEGVGKDLEGAACPLSFAPNTAVDTPSGEKAIASLKVGDQVTAYDPASGKTSTQTVQYVWINHDTDLIDLTLHTDAPKAAQDLRKARMLLDGDPLSRAPPQQSTTSSTQHALDEVVHTTAKHPFLTAERGWVPAGQLTTGLHVIREDGSTAVVVREHVVPGAAAMWNLTVSQIHTYAVGVGQYVVHNCGLGKQAEGEADRLYQGLRGSVTSNSAYDRTTVAVGIFKNTETGEFRTVVSTNNNRWKSLLDEQVQKMGAIWQGGKPHAEMNILAWGAKNPDWELQALGSSRNFCARQCFDVINALPGGSIGSSLPGKIATFWERLS